MAKLIKIFLLCFIILVIAGAIYYFIINPLFTKVVLIEKQVTLKEIELAQIKAEIGDLAKLEQTLRDAQVDAQVFEQRIPVQLTIANIYERILSLTSKSGLKVKQISTKQTFEPFAKDQHLKYIPINIEGTACFSQFINFLDRISQSTLLLQVEKFNLTIVSKGSEPKLGFKIVINAFEYSSDAIK